MTLFSFSTFCLSYLANKISNCLGEIASLVDTKINQKVKTNPIAPRVLSGLRALCVTDVFDSKVFSLKVSKQLFVFAIFFNFGCTKWVSVAPPVTQVTAAGAFANDATAAATVAGLYSQVMQGNLFFLNGGTTLYPGLSADELYRTSPEAGIDAFTANAIPVQSSVVANDLWGKAYSYLYQMNACLEGIEGADGLSENARKRLSGEVLFMRGLSYFYLANLFGGVPLETGTDYTVNGMLGRADTGEVYKQILADLDEGETRLEEAGVIADNARPSVMACAALRARVYLYLGNWEGAMKEASRVIESGSYGLESLEGAFLAGSKETIFSMVPVVPSLNTAEGLAFIPYAADVMPPYAATDSLVAAFEPGDERKAVWMDSVVLGDRTYHYPFKYKARGSDAVVENNVVLRLGEVYLIRAEARVRSGDIEGAREDVNVIRVRAHLPLLGEEVTGDELIGAVMRERRVELFCEWGHRWLDLKRWGTVDAVLGYKAGWEATDVLYPIPYGQILLNRNLKQNEGY